MMLGSNAREDRCRICEGDGSTCNTMSGLLDMQDLQVGKSFVKTNLNANIIYKITSNCRIQ